MSAIGPSPARRLIPVPAQIGPRPATTKTEVSAGFPLAHSHLTIDVKVDAQLALHPIREVKLIENLGLCLPRVRGAGWQGVLDNYPRGAGQARERPE